MIRHLHEGIIDLEQAAMLLDRSTRQVRRLLAAWLEEGRAGLVHGNRGRAPVNRTHEGLRKRIAALASGRYGGANRAHLAELLEREQAIVIPARTLRRILDEAGQPSPRPHRTPRHRSRRERAEREGHLLQLDGSRHRWFGPEHPFATLVGAIDDATGTVTGGTFRAQEDGAGYFGVLTQTSERHGLPWLAWTDRHGIFHRDRRRPPTIAEQLTGQRSLTAVGRALEVAGIGWQGTGSPQAKGRIERTWGTLQDRTVIELRLEGITTLEQASSFLPAYLERHNARFAVPAAVPTPAWRSWPAGHSAEAVFAFWYERRVARDDTLPWGQEALKVPPRPGGRTRAGQKVILAERLDGSLWAELDGAWQRPEPAPPSAPALRARHAERATAAPSAPDHMDPEAPPDAHSEPHPYRPAQDHPWRRPFKRR